MRRLMGLCLLGLVGGFLAAPAAHAGMILNFFPSSVYNSNTPAMYSTLGINGGYMIDDFEGPTLLPGLSISLTGGVPATTWTSSVPNLSNGFDCGIPTWDGTHAVTNSVNNMLNSCQVPSGLANLTTFTYAPGTTSFGIGLVNFQSLSSPLFPLSDHELIVNGTDLGTLESLAGATWTPGQGRNAYLRIDATGGSFINTVAFRNTSTGEADYLVFDTLAFAAFEEPEPATGWLLLLGTLALAGLFRRTQRASKA
jgi:hypothetical protein